LLEEFEQLKENGKIRAGIVVSCGVPHYQEALHTNTGAGLPMIQGHTLYSWDRKIGTLQKK
jgi:hypothetical protein